LQGEINELFDTKEDMKSFGFDIDNLGLILDDKPDVDVTATKKSSLNKYSKKIDIPQYEIVGEKPKLSECYDTTKYDALMLDIINSDIPDEEKKMLKYAAARHIVFNYGKIAEYYAGSEIPTQQLMEDSALIIIDFEDAIRDGYVLLNKNVEEIRMQEDGAEPMVDEYTDDDSEV